MDSIESPKNQPHISSFNVIFRISIILFLIALAFFLFSQFFFTIEVASEVGQISNQP